MYTCSIHVVWKCHSLIKQKASSTLFKTKSQNRVNMNSEFAVGQSLPVSVPTNVHPYYCSDEKRKQ